MDRRRVWRDRAVIAVASVLCVLAFGIGVSGVDWWEGASLFCLVAAMTVLAWPYR